MISPVIIFTALALWTLFVLVDSHIYSRTSRKETISYEEWISNGPIRFIPGSGFYLAWKYRNR